MTQPSATRTKPILDGPTSEFFAAVAADPLNGSRVGVLAPGGYGKTTLLGELDHVYRRAGARVLGAGAAGDLLAGAEQADAVLLVDDAHQLPETQLRELLTLARTQDGPGMVVAYRPWPTSPALGELTSVLGRARPPLAPGPFDRARVADFLTSRCGAEPGGALAELAHTQTGGVPRLLDCVAAAVTAGNSLTDAELPASALAPLRHHLDQLDPDVQRFLLAVEAGVGLHVELLAGLLGRDVAAVAEIMDAARATGLLAQDGTLLPLSRRAVRLLIPAERRIAVRQRLAELQRERGGPVLPLARSLLGTGVAGANVASVFHAAAEEAVTAEPALAARFYAAAVSAGKPAAEVTAGWALASALAGDLDPALRLADQLIAADDPGDRAEGARVAGAALAHRGQLDRSAALYQWAGSGYSAAFAAIGRYGTGQLAEAEALLAAPAGDAPPTLLAGAAELMAAGVRESITGAATSALACLVRASAMLEPAGPRVLLPDSPAATAALIALHAGELGVAGSVLDRAIAVNLGGPLMSTRHRLLRAWIAMMRGNTTAAREGLLASTRGGRPLEPRDWLFAVALEVGIARRTSDVAGLRRIWTQVGEAVLRHPVDLFVFLPLGEFTAAAARLRDQARLAPHLDEAHALLSRLGDPPLWSSPLHWSALHAAIIAEQHPAAERHAAALAANAGHGHYQAVLAAAAECWLAVMAGRVDPDTVEESARALHAVGLWWDGARLAGQAAIRTSDRKAMVGLLNCARALQGRPTRSEQQPDRRPAANPGPAAANAEPPAAGSLSDREREVADLVLGGLTYKQVGDRLFISAKTVEHHMARMRNKLGAASRNDLLEQLRELTGRPR
ncbi:MAG TPA: helix-turn-helix transcriptional regulator [Pseudonocardiaceae bacterium]|nr:helix-turn-helix transcriptional regulator [Pseudonocardiaceae bacterium]